MFLSRPINTVRHIPRYHEVANILVKYGFGYLIDNISIPGIRFFFRRKKQIIEASNIHSARRLKKAIEELGPTFIKLGQIISTRADLLPPEYIQELENLQDNVPAFTYEKARSICETEGICIEKVFRKFNPEPIAAASIGQVHEAVLWQGERVVVKIKRPGIDETVKTDLEIMKELAGALEKRFETARFYRLSEIVNELGESLLNELNFEKEARNVDIFYNNFQGTETVIIPRVYWEFTSKTVMTLEYVEGIKISDYSGLKQLNYDTKKIAENIVEALYLQVFEHGFFHADPHPGNIAISQGEKIIFYDFGQVGVVDDFERDRYLALMIGMMRYDVNGVTRALFDLAVDAGHVNVDEVRRDVAVLARKYYGVPLSRINIGEALAELINLSWHYKVRLPSELSLLVKMLVTIESTVAGLDPAISLVDIAEPWGKKALKQRYSREKLKHELADLAVDYSDIIRTLPRQIHSTVRKFNDGDILLRLEHQNLEKLTSRLDFMSNRLSLAIILAAIIVGTSLVVEESKSNFLGSFPLVEAGFILAVLIGLFLAYSILRSGRY